MNICNKIYLNLNHSDSQQSVSIPCHGCRCYCCLPVLPLLDRLDQAAQDVEQRDIRILVTPFNQVVAVQREAAPQGGGWDSTLSPMTLELRQVGQEKT